MTRATIADAIRHGAACLAPVTDKPAQEARILLAHALGIGKTDLIRDRHLAVATEAYQGLLTRRAAREPIALILGRQEFWSMEFETSSATLIPRADSETLIEAALDVFANRLPPRRILDLGTGTGCLLLALLREFPGSFGIGVDINPAAATLARRNVCRLGMNKRASVVVGDWTNPLSSEFDLVVANPPYIASTAVPKLMAEVAMFEPRRAVDGGDGGLDAYQAILPRLGGLLARSGVGIFELGAGQADEVALLADASGFAVTFRPDLAGIARAAILMIDSA